MSMLLRDLVNATDPISFCVGTLKLNPDPWQRKFLQSKGLQHIFNVCRQAGKSTIAAVLALWIALYHPGSLILLVSPSLRQSRELFAKVMSFLRALEPAVELEADNL